MKGSISKANDVDRNIKEAREIYKQRQVQGNVLDIIYKEEAKENQQDIGREYN